uniref:Glycosyltransferase 2-like domain-containing protein n=1 Tax=viral metagenome TaxID=1070528 RepID=A0A6C0JHU9_9ZZZZ
MDNITFEKTPTICFITMCKNEEHCIESTLESVYKYIDYWIVCDTGSTDNTCDIVKNFFKEKNIPGELFVDEWKGFDKNKSLMFERAYKKTDFVLHLDADDFLVGNFNKNLLLESKYDIYNFNYIRGTCKFKTSSLYNNQIKWKYVGVAHNLIKCLDKHDLTRSNIFTTDDLWVDNNERGARKFDPNKYINDALKLKEQFFETLFEDPDNLMCRSVFYTAQSYMDSGHYKEAIQWYTLYSKLKDTWSEELFESNLRIARCMIRLSFDEEKIKTQIHKTIDIFPDRAEPYFVMGKYYNSNSKCHLGYDYLKQASNKNLSEVLEKYMLFVNKFNYGKYVNDELSVACYWTNRLEEGYALLNQIIDDEDFKEENERLLQNKAHYINKMSQK